MKKNFFLLAAIVGLFGCKKNNSGPAKDYTALLKNSIWTGEFNYTGKPSQPVSISFQDGGQVTWYELVGSSSGTWKVDNGLLSVSLSTGAGFKTTIADDNTFSGIQNLPVNGFALTNAALNTLPDQLIDNTSWAGTNVALHFKAGNKLDMELGPAGSTKYTNLSYVREAKTIRFSALPAYKWFIVSSSIPAMKGANQFSPDPTTYTFQVTKQ